MSEKTATVKDVVGVRKWEGQNGTVFYHQIVLDNGDNGTIGKKAEGAVKVGDTLTYTIEETQHGNRIKQVQAGSFGGGSNGFQGNRGGARGSSASFALSYAKDLMIAQINANKTADAGTSAIIEATLIAAGRFNTWLKENE